MFTRNFIYKHVYSRVSVLGWLNVPCCAQVAEIGTHIQPQLSSNSECARGLSKMFGIVDTDWEVFPGDGFVRRTTLASTAVECVTSNRQTQSSPRTCVSSLSSHWRQKSSWKMYSSCSTNIYRAEIAAHQTKISFPCVAMVVRA